jgi:hypothetical protein
MVLNHTHPNNQSISDYVDTASFIDFVIFSEFSRNVDAYQYSIFLYKDRGQKLAYGPIWDCDLGYGMFILFHLRICFLFLGFGFHLCAYYCSLFLRQCRVHARNERHWLVLPIPTTTLNKHARLLDFLIDERSWILLWLGAEVARTEKNSIEFEQYECSYWQLLAGNSTTMTLVNNEWKANSLQWLSQVLQSKAIERNFARWIIEQGSPPRPISKMYDEEVEKVRNWLSNRTTWIDSQIQSLCT